MALAACDATIHKEPRRWGRWSRKAKVCFADFISYDKRRNQLLMSSSHLPILTFSLS